MIQTWYRGGGRCKILGVLMTFPCGTLLQSRNIGGAKSLYFTYFKKYWECYSTPSTPTQKNMEYQIWSHSRWSLCNKVVLGLDQDEDGLVLRYQGCILAISDNFIPKSMPKLSIFSKKRYHFLSKNGQNQGLIFVQFCWKIPELSWHQKN